MTDTKCQTDTTTFYDEDGTNDTDCAEDGIDQCDSWKTLGIGDNIHIGCKRNMSHLVEI